MKTVGIRIAQLMPGKLGAYLSRIDSNERRQTPAFRGMVDVGPNYTLVEGFTDAASVYVPLPQETGAIVKSMSTVEVAPAPFFDGEIWPRIGTGRCVDFRFYQTTSGRLDDFVEFYSKHGYPVQSKVLGPCAGFYIEREKSMVFHFWNYASPQDRTDRRRQMKALPAWQDYLVGAAPLLNEMNNWLLEPMETRERT